MTKIEAQQVASGRLRFGDERQIYAVNLLEAIEALTRKAKAEKWALCSACDGRTWGYECSASGEHDPDCPQELCARIACRSCEEVGVVDAEGEPIDAVLDDLHFDSALETDALAELRSVLGKGHMVLA